MKKLPDCRKSPAKASGKRRWACSIANAPRLTPAPTGRRTATASAMEGRTRVASVRAYSALAEYHWSRSPGATSATRWRGSAPAAMCAALWSVRRASSSSSGPSWATSRGSRSSSRASRGRQIVTSSSAPSALDATVRRSLAPGTRSAPSHAGGE